ncbi:hypothetical protein BH23ACT8_BH23ACT8_23440 [soil metagenome]
MRKPLMVTLATVAIALGTAVPASAADTTTTFAVDGGALSISAPATADLGSGGAAGTIAAQLGSVTATDARAALAASWTASVAATAFANTTTPTAAAIPNSRVDYWSGAATTTGTAVFLPGQALAANKVDLSAVRTAYSASATVGSNSATWNPTLEVRVPADGVAGTYSGTVTHSVV